ncbi:MAG: DMT family transporter [Pseudooceanicola sp.]|nr:DMT family transporter [Pseudooceanicola sp.]
MNPAAVGAGLVVLYTALIALADAITKQIGQGFAAPQLFALSGAIVVALTWGTARATRQPLRTGAPRTMALRSGATVVSAVAFFQAFHHLPFAEVFLFIGLMPILAGLMSGPILGEHVRPAAWAALAAGFVGMLCLFPAGLHSVGAGHLWALGAAVSGTFSMVLARRICAVERNALAQVFWPNLALGGVMALALPFVWLPMGAGDVALVAAYAALLFGARWLTVLALRLLPAYTVTPLMNLQFVWMVALGALLFGERPSAEMLLGVAIVIASGSYLVWDRFAPATAPGRLRTDP